MKFTRVLSASVLAGAVLLSSTACGFSPKEEEKKEPSKITMTTMPNPGDVTSTDAPSTSSPSSSAPSSGFSDVIQEPESSESSEPLTLDMDTNTELEQEYVPEMTADSSVDQSWDEAAAVEEKYVAEEPAAETVTDPDAENAAQATRVAATLNDFYAYTLNPATYDQLVSAGKQFAGRDTIPESEILKFAQDNPTIFRHFDTSSGENVRNAFATLLTISYIGKNVPGISITIPVETVTVSGDYANVDVTRALITRNGEAYSNSTDAGSLLELNKLSTGAWVMVAPAL